MDGYKSILVQLENAETSDTVLETALTIAKKFDSHLDIFHVHPGPSCLLPVPVIGGDMTGFVVNNVVEEQESAYTQTADRMRLLFQKFIEKYSLQPKTEAASNLHEVTAEFREIFGCEDEVIAWCSRVTDLAVLPRPSADLENPTGSFAILNAALMESGSAVVLAPNVKPVSVADRVAIAWDASEETAKAVTFAMPFLVRAKEVCIFETAVPNEDWAGADVLSKRLKWHGVDAPVVKMEEKSSVTEKGENLVKATCGRYDLLVAGAFTQSTMRRWILGSTTKYLIDNADIPLLMAH